MTNSISNAPFSFRQGNVPLLVSFPHSSTYIPESLQENYTEIGRQTPDTDWYLPKLYQIDDENSPLKNVSIIQAEFSRFVIDPNRPTDGTNLYPGKPTPELCPTKCFDGSSIYKDGLEPDKAEIDRRTQELWQPYHHKIREELDRMKDQFGIAILFDAHSILSEVPRLFEGALPNFNMGTAAGKTAAPNLEKEIETVLKGSPDFSYVFNGRFIGGYITRSFGCPEENIHSIQLELTQTSYMDEASGEYCEEKASLVRPVIFEMVSAIKNWVEEESKAVQNR